MIEQLIKFCQPQDLAILLTAEHKGLYLKTQTVPQLCFCSKFVIFFTILATSYLDNYGTKYALDITWYGRVWTCTNIIIQKRWEVIKIKCMHNWHVPGLFSP